MQWSYVHKISARDPSKMVRGPRLKTAAIWTDRTSGFVFGNRLLFLAFLAEDINKAVVCQKRKANPEISSR